jgi:MoaA/NifB/PqqE/SkfB family radical SAM enzyme
MIRGLNYTEPEKERSRLLEISLSLSRRCDLDCLYCFTEGGIPRPNELTMNQQIAVLGQASLLGAKTWYLAGDGEPLLDPNFERLIGIANGCDLRVVAFTDGTLLDAARARRLKEKDLSLIVKWNSTNPETFKYLTGSRKEIAMVERDGMMIPNALNILLDEGYAGGTPTRAGIETVITAQNEQEIPLMREFCERNNVYAHIERMLLEGRARAYAAELTPGFVGVESLLQGKQHLEAAICPKRISYSLYVRSDGETYACFGSHQDLHLGSVKQHLLAELLEKRDVKVAALRARFPNVACICAELARGDQHD